MSELLSAALRYCPRTVPLHARSKRPAVADWPNWSATPEAVTAWWSIHPNSNVGIRCGGGLAVLDVDPRHGGDLAVAQLEKDYGPLPFTPEAATGGGGRHLYYRAPRTMRLVDQLAPGLELKGAGRQVVAPPSVHPETGRPYCWHRSRPLLGAEIAPLPGWLALFVGRRGRALHSRPATALPGHDPLERIPATDYVPMLTGRELGRGGKVRCPFHAAGAERTPSLHAYADNGGWWCYSCARGGSIVDLGALLYDIEPRGAGFHAIRRRLAAELLGRVAG